MISSSIIEISSNKPGPTLAVMAGVHGNELAGVYALQQLLPTLSITRGKLYIIFANPPAIEANVRMIAKNLNRCFTKDNSGSDPEDIRARELMKILDQCDALLDLHMFYDDNGQPFIICEENAVDIATKFDIDIISTNWANIEPGASDDYMYKNGKIGICVECGPISKADEYTDFAINTIYQFLAHFDMTNRSTEYSEKSKRTIKAIKTVYKDSSATILVNGLRNFERLRDGQVIATNGTQNYTANDQECIIFPHYNASVGEELYIIGTEVTIECSINEHERYS